MTDDERDDLLLASYIQQSRIYDVLLAGLPPEQRRSLVAAHEQGQLLGPVPSLEAENAT